MASRNCVHGCRPPYYDRNRPCPACREKHDRDMDDSYELCKLGKAHAELLKAIPATDREWLQHLDESCPVEPVASVTLDFRSKPGIDSLPSFWETN